MKTLKVTDDGRDFYITGLSSGNRLLLLNVNKYGEVDSIDDAKSMLSALNDAWSTSDELGRENEAAGGDGLVFNTAYGPFATYSYAVLPVSSLAKTANYERNKKQDALANVENTIREALGFGRERRNQIRSQYGDRFENWPRDLVQSYWDVEEKANSAGQAFERGDIETLINEELCRAFRK